MHWLWLYEFDKLDNICEGYAATGKADSRLTCESDGGRDCGRIRLLCHMSIGATPVSGISSDRICAVRLSVDDGDSLLVSVIGVYMPCSDQGLKCYRDHLIELERVISEFSLLGPVVILGDFNAHLGSLGNM